MKIKIAEIGMKAAGVSAGAVLAKFANRFVPNLNPAIRGGAKIVIGAAVPAFMPKSKLVENIGMGMMAVGAVEVAENFVPAMVSGVNENPVAGLGASMSNEGLTIDEDYEPDMAGVDDDDDDMNGTDDIVGNPDDDDDDM